MTTKTRESTSKPTANKETLWVGGIVIVPDTERHIGERDLAIINKAMGQISDALTGYYLTSCATRRILAAHLL